MLVAVVSLALTILIPLASFLYGLSELRLRRKERVASLTSPRALRTQAETMAQHAIDNDLAAGPWYQLAAFWGRISDYDPEAVHPPILLVEATPKEPLEQHTWTLKGTDEDAHVVEALHRHGVVAEVMGPVGHMVGTKAAIEAAEADYRYGLVARRATS